MDPEEERIDFRGKLGTGVPRQFLPPHYESILSSKKRGELEDIEKKIPILMEDYRRSLLNTAMMEYARETFFRRENEELEKIIQDIGYIIPKKGREPRLERETDTDNGIKFLSDVERYNLILRRAGVRKIHQDKIGDIENLKGVRDFFNNRDEIDREDFPPTAVSASTF
jgi:hypothetical protein